MGVLARNSFSALKKKLTCNFFQKCTQPRSTAVPGSARNLRKSYRGIFEKTPYMYRFPFSPQYGGTSEKLRENIFSRKCCCTKYLPRILDQHCIPLQFGVLFIIMQNLEIFWRGFFQWTSMPKEIRIPIYSLNYWAREKYVGGPRFWRLGPPKGLY